MRSATAFEEIQSPVKNIEFCIIDGTKYLRDSYALRYEVYCNERNFLVADDYPSKLEIDHFDEHAIHFGAINAEGVLVATVRLVLPSKLGLPLFEHCTLFNDVKYFARSFYLSSAEISRLAVLRSSCKSNNLPQQNTLSEATSITRVLTNTAALREKLLITFGLYQLMYRTSKLHGFTHWFASMERSLVKLLNLQGVQFRAIGPEVDYYGPVMPYLAKISHLEAHAQVNNFAMW
jgi:N-acyl amino acid synthase of PEP-CTERM/exosortase system